MDGKTPLLKLDFMRILSGMAISPAASFSIEAGISSGPAAFEDFKEFKALQYIEVSQIEVNDFGRGE